MHFNAISGRYLLIHSPFFEQKLTLLITDSIFLPCQPGHFHRQCTCSQKIKFWHYWLLILIFFLGPSLTWFGSEFLNGGCCWSTQPFLVLHNGWNYRNGQGWIKKLVDPYTIRCLQQRPLVPHNLQPRQCGVEGRRKLEIGWREMGGLCSSNRRWWEVNGHIIISKSFVNTLRCVFIHIVDRNKWIIKLAWLVYCSILTNMSFHNVSSQFWLDIVTRL